MTTKLSVEAWDQLREDFSEYGEWRTYSGRSMYGKYCVGFDCDGVSDLVSVIVRLAKCYDEYPELDEFIDRLDSVSSDSIGLGMIYYWRGVELDTDPED